MNPIDVQSDIREYDILMDGGSPKVPDAVYGRGVKAHRQARSTRPRSSAKTSREGEGKIICSLMYDANTGGLKIVHTDAPSES